MRCNPKLRGLRSDHDQACKRVNQVRMEAGFRFVQTEQRWRSWATQRGTEGEQEQVPVGQFASVQRTQRGQAL